MRVTLPFEVIASVRLPTWHALFAALGSPPGLAPSASSHAVIAAAMRGADLPLGLARALVTLAAFATEAGRVDLHAAASALGRTTPLPEATSPADLVALVLGASESDAGLAEVLTAAKILRDRTFRPRQTFVFLGAETVDPAVGEPTQYEGPIATLVAAWGAPRGFGAPVSVDARREGATLAYEVVHEGRAETVVLRDEVRIVRPLRSHALAYTPGTRGLTVTTDCMEAVEPLASIAGRALFGDPLHFLGRAALDLFPLQQRAASALAVKSLAGKVETSAIGGTWHSGKDHSVTPRGQDFFRALQRYKIRIDGGHLDAVTLRAKVSRHGSGPEQCDVALRPPHQLSISEPELAPLVHTLLDEARITNPAPRARDFFALQPWIAPAASWIEAEGEDGFDRLVAQKLLYADRSNRAVAPPGHPFGDRTATAYPLSGSKFLAVSPDPTVAPFVVKESELVVYSVSFERLAAAKAKELGLEGAAVDLDDDGVLRLGRRALGPAQIMLSMLTRPVRAATEQRLQDEAEHGHAILILPEARMRKNVLRQLAMPRLAASFRPLLGALARLLHLESQVETIVYAPEGTRVVVHRETQRVWIDGFLCEYVKEAHVRLLEYLIEHAGQHVHTKDLAEHVARGHQHEDTTRRAVESFLRAVEKSFKEKKKKPPEDLAALIQMPRHGRYTLGATAFLE